MTRCPRCLLHEPLCLCREVTPVATRVELVILRHAAERPRSTNTARWAALALPDARVVDYAAGESPEDLAHLAAPGACVLFPSPGAAPPGEPPARLVVPDGTWQQARRMVQRIPALQTMPRLALPPPPPGAVRLRRPTIAGGMSTIEAIAGALRLFGEEEAARALDAVHRMAIERARVMRQGFPVPRGMRTS